MNNEDNCREINGSKVNGVQSKITKGVNPYMFRNVISKNHIEFKTNKQQDAMEYLIWYLDKDKNFID